MLALWIALNSLDTSYIFKGQKVSLPWSPSPLMKLHYRAETIMTWLFQARLYQHQVKRLSGIEMPSRR
jgi:hypothetical protein